jgi:hypothetical protein
VTDDIRTLHLTQRERDLLLKYGYPDRDDAERLRASKFQHGVHVAHIDSFWLSMWIADIVRSAKKFRNQRLQEELDVLCEVLETAEQNRARAV